MCSYMRGLAPMPDNSKQIIEQDLTSITNYLLFDGSQSEQFALAVAREVLEKASKDQVRDAIESVVRKRL